MSKIQGRLFVIVVVAACLLGLAGVSASAGSMRLQSSPTNASYNSIWNISATWQDDDGNAPILDKTTITEDAVDFGFNGAVGLTLGSPRPANPPVWAGDQTWLPYISAPDGFVGFPVPIDSGGTDHSLPLWEQYEQTGYATIQPDPVPVLPIENEIDPAYDHAVDYVRNEVIVKNKTYLEVELPNVDHTLPAKAFPAVGAIDADDTHLAPNFPRPATAAVIVTSRVPVMLAGVWSNTGARVRAQIVNAASLFPEDPITGVGWPSYNVIQVMEDDKTIAAITSYRVCYYTPGRDYVITRQGNLPMPYTAYRIPLTVGQDGVPYLAINDGILNLDPSKTGDLSDKNVLAQNSPVLGIYATRTLADGGPSYFNLPTTAPVPANTTAHYEGPTAPGTQHPTFGKLFFTTPPPSLVPGTIYYVVVSTEGVRGVYTTAAGGVPNNLYIDTAANAPIYKYGYCAKAGIIRLARKADAPPQSIIGQLAGVDRSVAVAGQQLWVDYSTLSNTTVTVGRTGMVGLVDHLTGLAPSATFTFVSTDAQPGVPTGKFVIDTKTLPLGTYGVGVNYWPVFPMVIVSTNPQQPGRLDPNGVVWYKSNTPMKAVSGSIRAGATYGVSVSAGLKMDRPEQQPSDDVTLNLKTLNNRLIYDDHGWPMYYDSALMWGIPQPRLLNCIGYGVKDRALLTYGVDDTANVGVTVQTGITTLHCYSNGAAMPSDPDVDPLAVEPLDEANPSFPDDGSGSTQFVFRVEYIGGLPPLPWMRPQADAWGVGAAGYSSGVVLYLDEKGTGDYKPHFMQPDYETGGMGANIYMYRVIPHNDIRLLDDTINTWPLWPFQVGSQAGKTVDNDLYQSLQMGVYHYFFGTSSDSLTFGNGSFAFENQNSAKMTSDPASQTGLAEWGQIARPPYYSTGLDPSAPRAVTDYPFVDRAAGRRYSADDGRSLGDSSLYVDRTCRVPGATAFEGTYPYPYPADAHPRVTCELHMPTVDDFNKPYDHLDYGEGRFFGTLFPFRSAMNPAHSGVRGGSTTHQLAETSGSYSTDTNVFRIMYKQLDNLPPVEIKLWVNNASEKSPNDTAHAYTSYTMQRRPDQTDPDYVAGVWYEYKLQSGSAQLPYGPHTYYFTANDGEHSVRWPVRPDHYQYTQPTNPPNTWDPIDSWVPTANYAKESGTATYMDNDYVPGPFVNNAPQITNVNVTPSAGKEGTHFVYSATYTDPDGQRPFSAVVWIQASGSSETRAFAMKPDPTDPNCPSTDVTVDNSAKFKTGVRYILDTGTYGDLTLKKGVNQFYIEFIDDWGRQDDVNDRRMGETSRYPSGTGNWVEGPVISSNSAPTLSNGRVAGMDNTSNSATVWSFKVTYKDLDRDPPALIKVFIGRLQPQDITTPTPSSKVKTIIWDSGHTMLPSNPADTVYSHGVEYGFQTRLAGPETTAPQMVTKELTTTSAVSQIDPDPGRSGDIIRVWKVYTTGDPSKNYYSFTGTTPPDYVTGMITLNGAMPAGDVWIQYERRPVVQYYYAFEAYDGVDYATYKSSSQADLRSDASGCFVLQDAESLDAPVNLHYKIRPKIAKQVTLAAATNSLDPDPGRLGDIVRIWGVYANEDLTGTNYYPVAAGKTVPDDYNNSTHPMITLTGTVPAGTAWVVVEGDTPLVGPLPMQQSAPAGVIPDPEVFVNFTQNGLPQLITDQKNGFIDEFTGLVDRAVVFMGGQASLSGRPSSEYVAPDTASDIASVEGVYWLANPDVSHQYDNYYDAAMLVPPVVRVGALDVTHLPARYAAVPEPLEVDKVLGVYDNAGLTGINYYTGDTTQLKWQAASIMSDNVIWPSRPNDIAAIKGVYMSMNVSDSSGSFYAPDSDAANAMFVVPADVNLGTGEIVIKAGYNAGGAIKAILRINASADMTGQDFYMPTDAKGDPYDPAVPMLANQPEGAPVAPATATVYVSYVPAQNFGPDHEFMALRKVLATPRTATTVYIAYYPPGSLNGAGLATLAPAPAAAPPPGPLYLKVWAKGFNVGDSYIKLTTPLPDVVATGTVVNSGLVQPDPAKLADIGTVTGVFVPNDPSAINYYAGTSNPFSIGDTTIHLMKALSVPLLTAVTVTYLPRERDVTIKYSDARFTHVFTGTARQIVATNPTVGIQYDPFMDMVYGYTLATGTTHFVSDGLTVNNVNITGNAPVDPLNPVTRDIDGGIVGIWPGSDLTGTNYFNPRRTGLFSDNPTSVRLSTEVAQGSGRLYARAYQKGVYFLDRWNRNLRFDSAQSLSNLDRVQVSYFFGTRMTQTLVPNTLPVLSEGTVSPTAGSRNAQYVYSVRYKDIDGPTGQMPTYVKVYLDGVAFDMIPLNQGTPDYKAGALFTFTPTGGLSGKPHRFYFEASDGAAVAWFDKTGGHNSDRTVAVADIVEMDGPWVNDPPTLLNGVVAPNPTGQGAGIGTQDSVDYRVTLVDVDNDAPYFWDWRDTSGKDVSGSPRLWVDAGLSDDTNVPVDFTIIGLEPDPSEITKMRVIRAGIDDGAGHFSDPGWTTNKYAGQLLQISNGKDWADVSPSPYTSVYLIQSNTNNKLVIAADDLASDKLYPIPADPAKGTPRYATFRVNGLLMTKTNPNQVDNFAVGVDYKITVPRLQVGSHKFHFTARTREDKPDWLLSLPNANTAPYSLMVRFPALGDLTGPNVISKPADDNVAPVLSKVPTAPSSTLYRGPRAQAASVSSPTAVLPYDFIGGNTLGYGNVLTILGAFRNANFDAHLSSTAVLPADQPKDFFNAAAMGLNPPHTGTAVTLNTLYPCPNTMTLVQRSSRIENSKTVVPDAPSAIGTVLNVYLQSDPTLQNAYTVTSPQLTADNKITLNNPGLPAGTTDVFITYTPKTASAEVASDGTTIVALNPGNVAYVMGVYLKTDAGKTNNLINPATWVPGNATVTLTGAAQVSGTALIVDYVPWPPVYLKYYAMEPAGSPTTGPPQVHSTFKAGEPLTFAVFYKDANGDMPTYHNGVQGYVMLVFNDLQGRTAQLSALAPPTSYKTGVPYGVTLTDVPPGLHTYHFEASDGYVVTRYPVDQTGNAALDEKVGINYKPSIANALVDHSSGATTFTFSVTYFDQDNVGPAAGGFVKAIVTSTTDPTKTATVTMLVTDLVPNWYAGVHYSGTVDVGTSNLPVGTYNVLLVANDGVQDADQLAGPQITVRAQDPNHHPFITEYGVFKLQAGGVLGTQVGKTTDTFVYRARYKDSYDEAPVATFGGVRQTALSLIIDGDAAHPVPMTMVPMAGTPDYTGADATQWPWWEARVTGKTLKGGNHNYTVTGSDGTVAAVFDTGVPEIQYGPTLMIPYFALQVVGKDGSTITDQSIVGQEALVRGQMYFPYTQALEKPTDFSNIVIQVTKPDLTVVSLNASLTVRDEPTPDNWIGDITVHYSGYVDPALATGSSLTLVASGQWIIDASWVGDATYDGAKTDSVFDSHNDQVRLAVSGPSRTVATANPLIPDTTTPLVDMITPPMMIGSASAKDIFGPDRAVTMQIVKWVPSVGQYFRYDVSGYFPPLKPGDAVWIKPKLGSGAPGSGYPAAESISRSAVEDGWTALDNPGVQMADIAGSPRYLTSKYRLIKVLAQAYPLKTDSTGAVVTDNTKPSGTALPLYKPCTMTLSKGWNQFGCIFYNWKKDWQNGSVIPTGELPPPPPGGAQEFGQVIPSDPGHISKVLGVFTSATPTADDKNYFQPGVAAQPYVRNDATIHLTRALPAGVTTVHIKYEAYPKEDVGIPISEVHVTYLGDRKTLADARTAGWITDYAWRYDSNVRDYVAVSDTRTGAERVLKAWSGYWIKAYVDCDLEIDPNTTFNGDLATMQSARSLMSATAPVPGEEEMIAPPPAPKD